MTFCNKNQNFLDEAIKNIIKKIDQNIDKFKDKYPAPASIDKKYPIVDNINWTNSFWTGMLWLAYEYTQDNKYRQLAERHIDSFKERLEKKIVVDHHDLGFLYTLSCVSAYKVTNNSDAEKVALEAAEYLMKRYHDKAKIIQAWGDLNDPDQRGRMIIDCNMNLPLLYWASNMTGNNKYYEAAESHVENALRYIVREDYSTYHTYHFDVETGKPLKGTTHQGYSDDSCWARGQAWGIYGFILSYNYTKNIELLEVTKKIADYYLDRLPKDKICYWDLIFTDGEQERDSSAAAIAVCGLLELSKHLPDSDDRNRYKVAAYYILESLYNYYSNKDDEDVDGLLLHGVYNKNNNSGVDECCIWGDYYYFEALIRMKMDWEMYW